MAFNFNWSPLIADTSRARDMLTTALNKSPKPPIIVGDILVTELNLGSVPPELEILEIGDLAEDRFRGIFKMSYTGDAYLTLKTRVQANPLNTYLASKPKFASPEPLAASSGLTIPLQITLSDIRLSGFVILVFSKQKGITLVFRNDPVESLKVSSTFDSIPFVRDYLQKEIEGQLRELFMEDLPAIIHRLSLRLWSPDHQQTQTPSTEEAKGPLDENGDKIAANANQEPIDPLSSPPQDPFDEFGRPLDEDDFSLLDPSSESKAHMKFSQKNLLRLAALTESYSTLSLFTPPMRDVVFRAWAGAAERVADGIMSPTNLAHNSLTIASLSRMHGSSASLASSAYTPSEASSSPYASRRTSVVGGLTTVRSTTSISSGRYHRSAGHKRKHRVVNLRKKQKDQSADHHTEDTDAQSRPTTPTSTSAPSSHNASSSSASQPESYYNSHHYRSIIREGELETPPASPETTKKTPVQHAHPAPADMRHHHHHHHHHHRQSHQEDRQDSGNDTIRAPKSSKRLKDIVVQPQSNEDDSTPRQQAQVPLTLPLSFVSEKQKSERPSMPSYPSFHGAISPPISQAQNMNTSNVNNMPGGSILEQAWMLKMATEIARKVAEERAATSASAPSFQSTSSPISTGGGSMQTPLRDWGFWDNKQSGHAAAAAVAAVDSPDTSKLNMNFNNGNSNSDGASKARESRRGRSNPLDEEQEQRLDDITPPPAYAA